YNPPAKSANKSSFSTTFQGKAAGQKGNKECKIHGKESPHASDSCFILCKEKRPAGWPWGRRGIAQKIIETQSIHNDTELIKTAQGILDKAKADAEAKQ